MNSKISTVPTAIRLPREMYERLKRLPGGLAEQIRSRVELTFRNDEIDEPTRKLMAAVENLAVLVRLQTCHEWHSHPAANRVLRHAIVARLARLKGGGEEASFAPDELPKARLVAPESDDPRDMGVALEAVDFHSTLVDQKSIREFRDKLLKGGGKL
jgi:hypothetical protein